MMRFCWVWTICNALICGLSAQMVSLPSKVYFVSVYEVDEVACDDAGPDDTYIALHPDCLPTFLVDGYSGSWQMRTADTLILRIIYDEENLEDCGETLVADLNNRSRDMFLGYYFKVQFEPELISEAQQLIAEDFNYHQNISDEFDRKSNEVIIVIDSDYNIFYTDVDASVISMTEAGINAHIILHEVGHIWGLDHPSKCCYPCDSLPKHFMYSHVSPYPTYNKVMVSDWLEIINACGIVPALCSDCQDRPVGMRDDYRSFATYASISDSIAGHEPHKTFIYCIDCKVEDVALETTSLNELISLCKTISKDKKLLKKKFDSEFEYYNSNLVISTAQKKRYIDFQVKTRRLFAYERLGALVEAKKEMLKNRPPPEPEDPPVPRDQRPEHYDNIHKSVQRDIDREHKNIQRPPRSNANQNKPKGNN